MRHRGSAITPTMFPVYFKQLCARWLPRLLDAGVPPQKDAIIILAMEMLSNAEQVLQDFRTAVTGLPRANGAHSRKILSRIKELHDDPDDDTDDIARRLRRLIREFPMLAAPLAASIKQACCLHAGDLSRARPKPLADLIRIFGLDEDCRRQMEFRFAAELSPPLRKALIHELEINSYENRSLLAAMLDIRPERMAFCKETLFRCGIVDSDGDLRGSLVKDLSFGNVNVRSLFIRPLRGDTLPLEQFCLPPDEVSLVRRLLASSGSAPLHVLLYGAPGTGKSTFARSLARECGLKGWAVTSCLRDDDDDRRISLAACLHVAAQHRNGVVLVDEAERLLDTNRTLGRQTKDKAWLNDFLETPGQRVIWITNEVEHIDPAVRRRFTYSLYFKELDKKARADIWQQALARQKASRRLEAGQVARMAEAYQVEPAVINDAVRLSKRLYRGKKNFAEGLERVIQAHVRLQRGGAPFKPNAKYLPSKQFTLDGVCMEGSAHDLLHTLQRMDVALRGKAEVRPGCANLLFYGPPRHGQDGAGAPYRPGTGSPL